MIVNNYSCFLMTCHIWSLERCYAKEKIIKWIEKIYRGNRERATDQIVLSPWLNFYGKFIHSKSMKMNVENNCESTLTPLNHLLQNFCEYFRSNYILICCSSMTDVMCLLSIRCFQVPVRNLQQNPSKVCAHLKTRKYSNATLC